MLKASLIVTLEILVLSHPFNSIIMERGVEGIVALKE
jgi:hypothetical protein